MFRQMVMFALLWCFTSADWASYKRAFNKIYGPKEDVFRRRLFESQLKNVNAHNALYDQKLTTHRKFLTKSSDMTVEEIPKSRGAFAVNKTRFPVIDEPLNAELYQVPLPRAVDYREDPCMSRVKDQNGRGPCVETCWSFSVSGLLEYYYCKHTGRIFEFSEKYLVDCVGGESGCRSGHIDKAMEFLIARKKIASEASYPYNTDEQPCRQIEDGYDLSSLVSYDHGSGDQYLMRTLAYKGPVAVTMWAPSKGFDTFRPTDEDDIFESPECEGVKKTNHAVLVVGYGTNKNGDYWIVKNSWGKYWALDGYVKIRRGENYCNIADFIMTPNFV